MNKDTNFTNFEKEIQSILQSHTEVPPSSCWGDIVSQLDNTIANNNLLNNTSTNAKKLISGKIGLTITITTISTLCIVGFFYIYSNSDRNKENNNNKETFLTPITQINTQETTNDTTFFNTGEHTKNQIVDTSLYSEDISILPKDTFLETTTIADTTTYVLADTISELKTEQIVNIDKNSSAKQATTAVSKNETNQNFNSSSIEKSEDNTKNPELISSTIEQPNIFIPNIITPNGDTYNDCFEIFGLDSISSNILMVFSRNGKILFQQENYQNNWCAENQQDGVYYYFFKFIYKGNEFMRKGSITIIR